MRVSVRRSLVWPAMILAGLALGAFAFAVWPDATPTARSYAADRDPGRELASVAGTPYLGDLFVYELPSALLVDSIMATPQRVDAH